MIQDTKDDGLTHGFDGYSKSLITPNVVMRVKWMSVIISYLRCYYYYQFLDHMKWASTSPRDGNVANPDDNHLTLCI